jgi:hypothetical protein
MPTPSSVWRPVTPCARLQSPCPLLPASSVSPFCFHTQAAAPVLPPPPRTIAGHGRFGHTSSTRATPSCPKLLLPLAQPALTSTARGKLLLRVNRSLEFRPSSARIPASVETSPPLPLFLYSGAHSVHPALPVLGRYFSAPPHGQRRAPAVEPRHRAAMAMGELGCELLRSRRLHQRDCLGTVITMVVTSSPATSPSARSARSAPPLSLFHRHVGSR